MKTIFILPSMHFSGGVKVVIQLANRLHDMGMDIEIWYPTLPEYGIINLREQNYIPVNVPVHRYLIPSQIPHADTYIATAWDTAITVDRLCKKEDQLVFISSSISRHGTITILENTHIKISNVSRHIIYHS